MLDSGFKAQGGAGAFQTNQKQSQQQDYTASFSDFNYNLCKDRFEEHRKFLHLIFSSFLFRIVHESFQLVRPILQPRLLGSIWWTSCAKDGRLIHAIKAGALSKWRFNPNFNSDPKFNIIIKTAKRKNSFSNDSLRHFIQPTTC